jgi:glycosyltransferase involved in cell wall biosynthesis
LQVMPMAVHIEQPEQYRTLDQRRITRERWGLDPGAALVLFVFDVKSSLERKNPWGAIQAFLQAFPPDSPTNVQLVIKALRPGSTNQQWDRLQQQAAQDPRLKVIEADLKRADLLALIGSCDVFLSLHRSEGFGRGIAEAGILGLQVVTSGWGGNVDFCLGERFHLVPCAATPIPTGAYAQAEGHIWGEPDLQMAAEQLRQVVGEATYATGANSTLHQLAISSTGKRYHKALKSLLSLTSRTTSRE